MGVGVVCFQLAGELLEVTETLPRFTLIERERQGR